MDCADDWGAGTASAKALGREVLSGFAKEKGGQHNLRSALHYVLQASGKLCLKTLLCISDKLPRDLRRTGISKFSVTFCDIFFYSK